MARLLGLVVLSVGLLGSSDVISVKEHIVEIKEFEFVPPQLTVSVGDTIKWINRDIVPHTASANDGSWDTKELKLGESKTITVSKGMLTDYFCQFHPNMKAKLVFVVDQ